MTIPSDTELLNWLQRKNDQTNYTGKCVFRWSWTGRGWRLHETSEAGATPDVRTAIIQAMAREAKE